MPKIKDLTGERFGRLTVIKYYGRGKNGQSVWTCKCDCGTLTNVCGGDLRSGSTLSCGCLWRERIIEAKTTHGMSHSDIYAEYMNMKNRCYNEKAHNYKYYGGRGIKVCDKWRDDIHAFYDDVSSLPNFRKEGYSLDRIDNDGDYEPGNIRWATQKEQSINRRPRTCKNTYAYNGKKCSLRDISNATGIPYKTLSNRLLKGWDLERAFNTEVQEKFRHKSR